MLAMRTALHARCVDLAVRAAQFLHIAVGATTTGYLKLTVLATRTILVALRTTLHDNAVLAKDLRIANGANVESRAVVASNLR